jgi:anaerobic magnesium-protoporphyrin IX monomethyl ester cyclase
MPMKILLTHGYFLTGDPSEVKIMKPYPPLGILSLSAWLTKEGISNEVYDSTFSNLDALTTTLQYHMPDVIGIYSTLMTKSSVLKIISNIKESPFLKHTRIIIGGPDSRYNATNYLLHGVDVVIPGEGEKALAATIRTLDSGNPNLSSIPGVIFKSSDGIFIDTGKEEILEPAEIPVPARYSIDFVPYIEHWEKAHGYFSMNINGMRGCPYSCNWCSKSIFGNTYRRRSPESIATEMEMMKKQYNPDQIWFTDDVFTISKEWLKKFTEELFRRNLSIPYECISRSDCLSDEIFDLLAASGCKKLWIGAESGSQKVIDLMNRSVNIKHSSLMINEAKKKGLETGTFIMLGYPGEARTDILKTAAYMKSASPDEVTLGLAYPIKGTKFYQQVEPDFEQSFDWERSNERDIRFKRKFSDRFYRFAIRYLFNTYMSGKSTGKLNKLLFQIKTQIARGYITLMN